MKDITVYTKDNCPQCVIAKQILRTAGISFAEVNVSKSPIDRDWLVSKGHRSAPVIYVEDESRTLDQVLAEFAGNGSAKNAG